MDSSIDIGQLKARLGYDTTAAQKDLQQFSAITQNFMAQLTGQSAKASTAITQVGTATKSTGGAMREASQSVTGFTKSIVGATAAGTVLGQVLYNVGRQGMRMVVDSFTDAIRLSTQAQAAFLGLSSVARAFGVDLKEARKAAQSLSADGLMTLSQSALGLKNLLASRFDLPQSIALMKAFKDSAAFGRQASLSFGDAVVTATEGIKNQNSTLVDNAGVTKNLSLILKEAGFSADDLGKVSTDARVRLALFNGIIKETAAQTGDAQKLTQTYAGQVSKLESSWNLALGTIGTAITENKTVADAIGLASDAVLGLNTNLTNQGKAFDLVSDVTIAFVRGLSAVATGVNLVGQAFLYAGTFVQSFMYGTAKAGQAIDGFYLSVLKGLDKIPGANKVSDLTERIKEQQYAFDLDGAKAFAYGQALDESGVRAQTLSDMTHRMAAQLDAAADRLEKTRGRTVEAGDASTTAARQVKDFSAALGGASEAADKYLKRIGALRYGLTGSADIETAKELVDALRGVDLSQIEPAKLAHINDELLKGIEAYRRQLKAIPGDMRAAFEATRSTAMSWMDQSRDDMRFRIGRDQLLDEIALKAPDAKPDLWSWMDQDRDDSKFFSEVDLILDDILLKGQKLEQVRWSDLWTQSITDLVAVLDQAAARTDSLSVRAARSVALLAKAITSQNGVGIDGLRWLGASDVNENGRIRKVSLSERFAGGAMLASGFASLAGAGERMTAATSQGDSRAGRAISGAGEAAQIGMAFGPQAAAVAAAWGALVGALNNPADQARQSANKFLQGLSDSFDEVATSAQHAEAASESLKAKISGGQSAPSIRAWILIRDAYRDTGQTVEQAKKDFEELREAAERGPEAVARALAKINLQLERQTQLLDARVKKQDLLNQAVQRWGLSFEEAGQGFQRGQLAEQAEQMIEDFKLLTESGANPETVAARMAKAMSEFVQQARLTGTQVPEAMRPIVESLLQQGLLLDENGLAFQSMKSTGITFGQALESLFENVLLKLERLITALTAPLPDTPSAHAPSPLGEYTGQGAKPRTMHEGGIIRAHNGLFVGRSSQSNSLFGRLGHDEVPIVAKKDEAIVNAYMTRLMGGAPWVDAVNGGDIPKAVGLMTAGWQMPRLTMPIIPALDPMAGMSAAINSVSRPLLPAVSAPTAPNVSAFRGQGDGAPHITLNVAPNAIHVSGVSDPARAADAVLDAVINGVHNNRNGFRTKLRQKVNE